MQEAKMAMQELFDLPVCECPTAIDCGCVTANIVDALDEKEYGELAEWLKAMGC